MRHTLALALFLGLASPAFAGDGEHCYNHCLDGSYWQVVGKYMEGSAGPFCQYDIQPRAPQCPQPAPAEPKPKFGTKDYAEKYGKAPTGG
jgi:hypothetical protein